MVITGMMYCMMAICCVIASLAPDLVLGWDMRNCKNVATPASIGNRNMPWAELVWARLIGPPNQGINTLGGAVNLGKNG